MEHEKFCGVREGGGRGSREEGGELGEGGFNGPFISR